MRPVAVLMRNDVSLIHTQLVHASSGGYDSEETNYHDAIKFDRLPSLRPASKHNWSID